MSEQWEGINFNFSGRLKGITTFSTQVLVADQSNYCMFWVCLSSAVLLSKIPTVLDSFYSSISDLSGNAIVCTRICYCCHLRWQVKEIECFPISLSVNYDNSHSIQMIWLFTIQHNKPTINLLSRMMQCSLSSWWITHIWMLMIVLTMQYICMLVQSFQLIAIAPP